MSCDMDAPSGTVRHRGLQSHLQTLRSKRRMIIDFTTDAEMVGCLGVALAYVVLQITAWAVRPTGHWMDGRVVSRPPICD